jgi:hypothetical protein
MPTNVLERAVDAFDGTAFLATGVFVEDVTKYRAAPFET